LLRAHHCVGGVVLTASHNPGGPEGDFGIKYNIDSGGPAPDAVTEDIYRRTQEITEYRIDDGISFDLTQIGEHKFNNGQFTVSVVDSVNTHLELLKTLFDFAKIRSYIASSSLQITADAMSGVMGVTAKRVFCQELGVSEDNLIRCTPLEDFGGSHPDPNLVYAKQLVDEMKRGVYDFGVAFDGDGDRNMILGKHGFFVSPSDSLAVIAANSQAIPYFVQNKLCGVGRSLPTSGAVDKVCEALGLAMYETPTGWKYFGSLMESGRIGLCGEESFGTGSAHIREKDGIWAALAWLSILAYRGASVESVLISHWAQYGRHYYCRYDYEGVTTEQGAAVMAKVSSYCNSTSLPAMGSMTVSKCFNFSYYDDVTQTGADNQGIVFTTKEGSRVVFRLSGTGSQGATVRVYMEHLVTENFDRDVAEVVAPLAQFALSVSEIERITGRTAPTVIT